MHCMFCTYYSIVIGDLTALFCSQLSLTENRKYPDDLAKHLLLLATACLMFIFPSQRVSENIA